MIRKFLSFCVFLLQLVVVVVLLNFICPTITGAENLLALYHKPVEVTSYLMMGVYLFLLSSLLIGFSAVLKAWLTIRKESAKFKQRRKYDLNQNNWNKLKKNASPTELETALVDYALNYGADSHHFVRFSLIMKSVCHPGGRLPSLSDLRALTYAAEAARRPVWMLRVVFSSLLIIGILGTLVGVHASIDVINEDINKEKLPVAFIPSALAVAFTVLLIICRGIYRKKIDEYIGHLDRHTVSFYFPFFRPAENIAVQLQEIKETLASFSAGVKGLSDSVSDMHEIRDQLDDCGKSVNEVHEKINEWQQSLPKHDAESYVSVVESLRAGYEKTQYLRAHLLNQIEVMAGNFNRATLVLIGKDFEPLISGSTPFTQTVEETHQYAVQIPDMGAEEQESLKARWVTGEKIKKHLSDVVDMGGVIAGSLGECVDQSVESANCAVKTADLYTEMKDAIHGSLVGFNDYVKELNNVFADASNKLEAQVNSLQTNCVDIMKKVLEKLKTRNSSYLKEPTAYWYEIVGIVFMFALLWWNVLLTIGKFVIGYDE